MPPKRPPAPVDRPLSKAYLREFSGWSTALQPALSEPNSLRVMKNVTVMRDGGASVRPGMRSLLRFKPDVEFVGSHEMFFDEEGRKTYLVAVRELDALDPTGTKVSFRVISFANDEPELLTLEQAGFELVDEFASIEFTGSTTYVRYMQIDNKVFALSNGPEPMIMFWVGVEKKAKRITEIGRPDWTKGDRLGCRLPSASWISDTSVIDQRINRILDPSFVHLEQWQTGPYTYMYKESNDGRVGGSSGRVVSAPERVNACRQPLNDVPTYGIAGWTKWYDEGRLAPAPTNDALRIHIQGDQGAYVGAASSRGYVGNAKTVRVALDIGSSNNIDKWVIRVKFYNSNKQALANSAEVLRGRPTAGRKITNEIQRPSAARWMRVIVVGHVDQPATTTWLDFSKVVISRDPRPGVDFSDPLDGDMGQHYYWEDVPNGSTTSYHPPKEVTVSHSWVPGTGTSFVGSMWMKASEDVASASLEVRARNSAQLETVDSTGVTLTTSWVEHNSGVVTTPSDTIEVTLVAKALLAKGVSMYLDGALLEAATTVGEFFHGSYPSSTSTVKRRWEGAGSKSRSIEETFAAVSNPDYVSTTSKTLVHSTSSQNKYSFGFFYTVSNEVGESAPSRVTVVKTQRPWTSWKWNLPAGNGEPTGALTDDATRVADQLVVWIPQDVFEAAIAAGATHWDAYFYTWGPNDVPPVSATHFARVHLDKNSTYGVHSWARLTPEQTLASSATPVIPSEKARVNSSSPSKGSQGLVANDRLVLVGAPNDPARISWSGAEAGDFHDFSTSSGGGSKVLSSGNLYLTAAVKLWQNPQSVDTLTILNRGEDGRSNAYYMQPATITTMAESIQVMGFEEVTGMEGTVAPYGCEVVNNALYHPVDTGLVKSTANNYNLSHKLVSDTIANVWHTLRNMHQMVSCTVGGVIYYLVHNPEGAEVLPGCFGNEIWAVDIFQKTPTWSRWLVQGISLREMMYDDMPVLSVVRPDGIFAFDPRRTMDEAFHPDTDELEQQPIAWYLETNIQGANRAHDAWANLQQANIMVGRFHGQLRYGIRGKDVNGMDIDMEKRVYRTAPPAVVADSDEEIETYYNPQDFEDYFLLRKIMKEWTFYAGSITDDDVVQYSAGQINMVQYRYTPATVNVGYEYGSVETFEYGRSAEAGATTDSGTPQPYITEVGP